MNIRNLLFFTFGFVFALVIAASASSLWSSSARTPATVQWEYKEICAPKEMNKYGEDGWELVAATSPSSAVTCLFFKRAK